MAKHMTAVMVLLAASLPAGGLRGQQPRPANEPLLNVAGELTRADPLDPVLKKGFHKVYRVKLAAGAYYQIDLASKDFDAYLRLEDSNGKQVAEDDDSGGEQNARLVYGADRADSFRVIVTSYDAGKTGRFLLTVAKSDRAAFEQMQLLKQAYALDAEAQQLYQQAKMAETTDRLRKALDLRRQAFPVDRYPHGHSELARSINAVGSVLRAQGEHARAEPFYRDALAMRQALYPKDRFPRGHPDVAASLDNVGGLLVDQGEYAQAVPYCRDALAMYQALFPRAQYPRGHPDLATCLDNMASLLRFQGEFARAEPLCRDALAMCEALYPKAVYPRGHPSLATGLDNLGGLLKARGAYAEAERCFRDALAMNQALYPKAQFPRGHWDIAYSLNNVAGLLAQQGEYVKAEPFNRDALAMFRALYSKTEFPQGHPDVAHSLNNLAAVLKAQGKYAPAEPLYREAVAILEALYPTSNDSPGRPDQALTLSNWGALLHASGEDARAEPLIRRALQMFSQLARHLAEAAPEPVALNAVATFPLTRDGLLSVTRNRPESAPQTYEAIWHSRAALTRVYQRRHLALIAAAEDATVRKLWDDLQELRRQREQLIMAGRRIGAVERTQRLHALNQQVDTVELELLPQVPAIKHYEDLARRGPDALRKLLPNDAVLVDFLRYTHLEQDPATPGNRGEKRTERYLAFVVTRQDVQRVELGTVEEIAPAAAAWREAIAARLPGGNDAAQRGHEAQLARHAVRLRGLVWDPVDKRLPPGIATVYLAPDAHLTSLPWAALPAKAKDRVLLEDYALAVLPHGPFLLEQLTPSPPRSARRAPAADGLLLAGGIRYDDRPNESIVASRGSEVVEQKVAWSYLPGTEAERQLLARLLARYGPKLTANLNGAEAATAHVRREVGRCRYAHLGTHGFFADAKFRSVLQLDERLFERTVLPSGNVGERIGAAARSPLVLSGLVCSGANVHDTPERGILSADAIAGLLLDDLYLATLSACDTGLGDVAGGEGVFGLQRAFHIAGCKNVIASLWKVDDAATAALMVRFYSHLFAEDQAKRLPPIEALRRAQLELYRHPELIPAWAKGEQRGPGLPRPTTTPPPPDTPREFVTTSGRAPIRLWAAFTLSGAGR
jgi:CHAT domain-containing protein/tetratricopeptide (TPR) repeat protein